MTKLKLFILTLSIFFIYPSLPVAAKNIVDTSNTYTYEEMMADIKELKNTYPELIEYKTIGKTKFNRDIIAVKVGHGESDILISGSTHAREWITTVLNMKMIEHYSLSYTNNDIISKVRVRDLLNDKSIWFVPMINPDGVTLQQKGLSAFPKSQHTSLLRMNEGSYDFKRWKTNAEGIDLNRNYPPAWNDSSSVNKPSWQEYKGEHAFQTNEAQAMRDFTYEIKPKTVVAYHSSGRVLYWINKDNEPSDYPTAQAFSDITNYTLKKHLPYRGYTEWFVQEFGGIGFTPELAASVGDRHVPLSAFPAIWERNRSIGIWLAAETHQNTQHNPAPSEKKIILDEEFIAYSKPSFFESEQTKIPPGKYVASEESDNWYSITTFSGEKWVLQPSRVIEPPRQTTKEKLIKENSPSIKEKFLSSIDTAKSRFNKNVTSLKKRILTAWEGIPEKYKIASLVICAEVIFGILYFIVIRKFFSSKQPKQS